MQCKYIHQVCNLPFIFIYLFFIFIIFFDWLEANYFTILQWFLSYIDMNQPWIYMYSPSQSLLPPPSPPDPCGSSQCTGSEHLSHASNLGWPFIFIYLFGRVTELYGFIWPQNTLLGASNYLFKNNQACEFERFPPPGAFHPSVPPRSSKVEVESVPFVLLRRGSASWGGGWRCVADVNDGDVPAQGPLQAAITWLHSTSFISWPFYRRLSTVFPALRIWTPGHRASCLTLIKTPWCWMILVSSSSACTLVMESASRGFWCLLR